MPASTLAAITPLEVIGLSEYIQAIFNVIHRLFLLAPLPALHYSTLTGFLSSSIATKVNSP